QLSSLRQNALKRLIPLVPGALRERRIGDVHAGLVDDIDQLQDLPLRVWQPLIVSISTVVLGLSLVALLSPLIALVNMFFVVIAITVCVVVVSARAKSSQTKLPALRAQLVDALLERFESASVLEVFGATQLQHKRIRNISQQIVAEQQKQAGTSGITAAVLSLIAGAATLITMWLHWPFPGQSLELSAPVLAALIIVPQALFEVLSQVPQALQSLHNVKVSGARVNEILSTAIPPEIPRDTEYELVTGHLKSEILTSEPRTNKTPSSRTPSNRTSNNKREPNKTVTNKIVTFSDVPLVELRGVSAKYPGAKNPGMPPVSFKLDSGETLLITGESGAGKTTLANVLVRFLEPDGEYLINGVSVSDLSLEDVRSVVGLCEQTPHLFDADLRQNLKFARPEASDQELFEMLDRVGLFQWAKQRAGLDTRVGEHGALVSGGQAQRISLARAILAEFPVVILDEPTAGVDPDQADAIMTELLNAVPEDRAVIVISHTPFPSAVTFTKTLELSSVTEQN
ncbi:MAG TPA: thiol reductant ABC exporter subunit CydC, partial [Microbacteriaceae bacterium]|nr:thiol reductant ABC exporter subunit CydC [Microbacteriaceae bacterium]